MERALLIAESVKALKLQIPPHMQNLPEGVTNYQLLTDEACRLMDELDDLKAEFVSLLGEANGITISCWSAGSLADFTTNPFPSAIGVSYDGGWGEGGTIEFTKPLESVTLVDVWKACDQLIVLSGDLHHVFIETIQQDGEYISIGCGS